VSLVLVVLNDQIRPLNKIQNERNKQTYDTYAFTIDTVTLVLQDYYFTGPILEYNGIIVKKAQYGKRKVKLRNGIKGESPPIRQSWAEHRRGSHPGPTSDPPEQGWPKCVSTILNIPFLPLS
jgi:hypothetical protein